MFFSFVDACIKDHTYDYSKNIEQEIFFAKKKCLHIVKSDKSAWLRLWFKATGAQNKMSVDLNVTLKDSYGKQRRKWNLRSENVRNFIAEEKGDWFEIEEPESGNYDQFHLKFKLYSAGKTNTLYYYQFA